MYVYVVYHYANYSDPSGGYDELLNIWATEKQARAQCERLGADEHGWERYEVQGVL